MRKSGIIIDRPRTNNCSNKRHLFRWIVVRSTLIKPRRACSSVLVAPEATNALRKLSRARPVPSCACARGGPEGPFTADIGESLQEWKTKGNFLLVLTISLKQPGTGFTDTWRTCTYLEIESDVGSSYNHQNATRNFCRPVAFLNRRNVRFSALTEATESQTARPRALSSGMWKPIALTGYVV